MSVSTKNLESETWAHTLLGWVGALASKFAPSSETRDIGRQEFERIAQDLNLSTAELYELASQSGVTDGLLKRRLVEFGLSAESVRARHPDVLRDLERVCGNCIATKRCSRENAAGSKASRDTYCRNTPTLLDLQAESDSDVRASLPIGPACC